MGELLQDTVDNIVTLEHSSWESNIRTQQLAGMKGDILIHVGHKQTDKRLTLRYKILDDMCGKAIKIN